VIDRSAARRYFESFGDWAAEARDLSGPVACLAELVSLVLLNGGQVLLCGNGGSAADAGHFAGEMVGRFARERHPYRVTALTTNAAVLTAIANDYSVERVFARQVEASAMPGDCLVAISTSGRSPNVIAALKAGRFRGCLNVVLAGPRALPEESTCLVDVVIAAPCPATGTAGGSAFATPHIQEVHGAALHCLAYLVEEALAETPARKPGPKRPAFFLDRDGTLIEQREYLSDPLQVVLLPGAAEAVRELNESGVAAVLATNQSAVARGLIDGARLDEIHARLQDLLREGGARLDGIYHCPHHPGFQAPAGPCACRKPLPGMILRAAYDLELDLSASVTVGDTWNDVRAGIASGGRGILVLTGLGAGEEGTAPGGLPPLAPEAGERCAVASNVLAAVRSGLSRLRPGKERTAREDRQA